MLMHINMRSICRRQQRCNWSLSY